jgi:hypothetical protein
VSDGEFEVIPLEMKEGTMVHHGTRTPYHLLMTFAITSPDGPSYRGVARIMRPDALSAAKAEIEMPRDLAASTDVEQLRRALVECLRSGIVEGVWRATVFQLRLGGAWEFVRSVVL